MKIHITIYTMSTIEDTQDVCNEFRIGGSYVSRGRAIDELTDWIMFRMTLRKDIAHAVKIYDDANEVYPWARAYATREQAENAVKEDLRSIVAEECESGEVDPDEVVKEALTGVGYYGNVYVADIGLSYFADITEQEV